MYHVTRTLKLAYNYVKVRTYTRRKVNKEDERLVSSELENHGKILVYDAIYCITLASIAVTVAISFSTTEKSHRNGETGEITDINEASTSRLLRCWLRKPQV